MKKDSSLLVYQKYYSLANRNVIFTLNDHRICKGQIIGYYKGDIDYNEPYIIKWHLHTGAQNSLNVNVELFGSMMGEIISHSDIKSVHFEDDNTIINF